MKAIKEMDFEDIALTPKHTISNLISSQIDISDILTFDISINEGYYTGSDIHVTKHRQKGDQEFRISYNKIMYKGKTVKPKFYESELTQICGNVILSVLQSQ